MFLYLSLLKCYHFPNIIKRKKNLYQRDKPLSLSLLYSNVWINSIISSVVGSKITSQITSLFEWLSYLKYSKSNFSDFSDYYNIVPYPHLAAECMFELVVLLLPGHMWGSIGVHHLWACPCFSSSVLHIWFV